LFGILHELRTFFRSETASYNFGRCFHLAGQLIDGNDGEHDAVFRQVAAVTDHHIADDLIDHAGIDADAAHGDAAGFAGGFGVDFKDIAGFENE